MSRISSEGSPSQTVEPWRPGWLWWLTIVSLAVTGLVARMAPLFDEGGRIVRQFPTEDGYLSLQIARNMAADLGMSVAQGTIPTNGTQPFATWLWSVAFVLVDGDKVQGVLVVQLFEIAIATATAYMIYRVGRRLLTGLSFGANASLLAATAWYASPIGIPHTMNCLETGTYVLAVMVSMDLYTRVGGEPGRWSIPQALNLGLVLGWTFWVRNDAVFLIAAVCLVHWLVGARRDRQWWSRSLWEAVLIGATTIVIASPWLYYNQTTFGHLMPISGLAESYGASFGHNAHLVGPCLFEVMAVVLPIPQALESHPVVVLASSLAVAVLIAAMIRWFARTGDLGRPAILIALVYGSLLVGYYGMYFGAPHFVSRYFYPLSGLFALVWATVLLLGWRWLAARPWGRALVYLGVVGMLMVTLGLNLRTYRLGAKHQHFQVVEWVEQNVPEDVWVGAIQTGTLGYWHDRTLNLDGKVNPYALEAKLVDDVPGYVLDTKIEVLADWVGIADWLSRPKIAEHFELVKLDHEANLAVLRRK